MQWKWLVGEAFLVALGVGTASASDWPVIESASDRLAPASIEVHVGELIRWRATPGEHLHLSLDAHPGAHETFVRSGEIRATFLLPGVHTYKVFVMTDGRRTLSGTVIVKEAEVPAGLPLTCAPGSFKEICFEP